MKSVKAHNNDIRNYLAKALVYRSMFTRKFFVSIIVYFQPCDMALSILIHPAT